MRNMVNIAICDDDQPFAERLKAMIQEMNLAARVRVLNDGEALLAAYEGNRRPFDLILLDIEMPLLDGLETAKQIRKLDKTVVILFVTAFAKYALPACRSQPYFYILKPIRKQAFQQDLLEAVEVCRRRRQECLLIENAKGLWRLPYADILYIESFGRQLEVHTANTTVTYYQKIAALAKELEGQGFFQTHRSILVNPCHVKHVFKADYSMLMSDGQRLPVSHQKIRPFLDFLLEERGLGL